jgi:hypothetical protein
VGEAVQALRLREQVQRTKIRGMSALHWIHPLGSGNLEGTDANLVSKYKIRHEAPLIFSAAVGKCFSLWPPGILEVCRNTPLQIAVLIRPLLLLRQLAEVNVGYHLRGVRGWAHLANVSERLGRSLPEQLVWLHARGVLDPEDVRAPMHSRPVWVYRFRSDAADSSQLVAVPGAAENVQHFYAPPRARGALLLLRAVYADPTVPLRFAERGWITGRELGSRVRAENDKRVGLPLTAVDSSDLSWLAHHRLVERREHRSPIGHGPAALFWRVSLPGRSRPMLIWEKPVSGAITTLPHHPCSGG